MKHIVRKTCTLLAAACLAATMVPAAALAEVATLADEPASGTVEVDGNWTLAYTVADGEATIDYAESYPDSTADLSIPTAVSDPDDGADVPVTAIGEGAFCGNDSLDDYYHEGGNHLAKVTLPDSVRFIERNAFRASSATSLSIGTGIAYVESYGVSYNASMEAIDFADGAHPEFLASYAFAGNAALLSISVPGMDGTAYSSKWSYRLGDYCFTNCTSLKTVTFEAGTTTGGVDYSWGNGRNDGSAPGIASGAGVFNSCSQIETLITYLDDMVIWTDVVPTTATIYCAAYFYGSKEKAAADVARQSPDATALVRRESSLTAIAAGTLTDEDYYGNARVPDVSIYDESDDAVWGFDGDALNATPSRLGVMDLPQDARVLSIPVIAYPVSRGDMDYAYVQLNGAESFTSGAGAQTQTSYTYYLYSDGVHGFDKITACAADGKEIDSDLYTLVFDDSNGNEYVASQVTSAGSYTACAKGIGDYLDTQATSTSFSVAKHEAVFGNYTSEKSAARDASQASNEAAPNLSDPAFVVMAPADNWQASLVATAYAGSGNGLAVFSDGTDTDDTMFQAIVRAHVDHLSFVGPTSQISQAAIDRAKILVTGGDGAYNYFSDADAEALALDVYDKVAEFGPTSDNPHQWGDAAILMSPTSCLYTASISQYAYAAAAPVLYTKADGSISTDTKDALSNFDNVVVAGDEEAVPASTVSTLEASGATVTRICDESQAYESSISAADLMATECGATSSTVCVADATSPACVMAAAQLSAISGGITYTCASSAETKACQQMLYQDVGADAMDAVYLVGPFASDAGVSSRMKDIVDGKEMADSVFAFGNGDTFEAGGLLFTRDSASTATLSAVADTSLTTVNASTAAYEDASYTVNALSASALANNKQISSVALGNVPSIPANAMKGCTALKTASFAKATKMAASSFAGCTSLTSVSIPNAASIPASSFKGLKKLSSVTAGSATSIGTGAFQSCSALKSASFSAAKTIGSSSFAGCTSLTSVKLSKVTSVPASAFAGDKKLKSTSFGTVTSVGASSFANCSALTSAPVAKATSIGASAFAGCTSIKSIKASSVKTIGASAFKGAKKMTKANLASKKLKSIGANAFSGDKSLKKVTIKSTKLKKVGKKAFKGTNKKMTVKVPKAKVKKYKKLLSKAGISKKAKVKA